MGVVHEVREDGLTLNVSARRLEAFAYADMQALRLLVVEGVGADWWTYTWRWSKRGGLVGAVAFGLIGAAARRVSTAVRLGVVGGGLGAAGGAVGGIVRGSLATKQRWESIPIPGSGAALAPSIRIGPAGAPTLGLTLTF